MVTIKVLTRPLMRQPNFSLSFILSKRMLDKMKPVLIYDKYQEKCLFVSYLYS